MSINSEIISYLAYHQSAFGGKLARDVAGLTKHKESIVERRARELEADGIIKATYEQIDGKGPKVVKYHRVEGQVFKPRKVEANQKLL